MPIDLEKTHHWGTLFDKNGTTPSLPEQLTSKWWSKQKQIIAAGKETGIGEALDKLVKLFKTLGIPYVVGRSETRAVDLEKCDAFIKSSGLAAFVKQVKEVKKLAEDHAPDFKSAVYKKTATALAEILEAAQELEKMTTEKHLNNCKELALRSAVDGKLKKIVDNVETVLSSRTDVLNKLAGEVEQIQQKFNRFTLDRRPASGFDFGKALGRLARDMTQALYNMELLVKGGCELANFDPKTAASVREGLEKWGDAEENSYTSVEDAGKDFLEFRELLKKYIKFIKPVKRLD